MAFKRIGHLKTIDAFQEHLGTIGISLPVDAAIQSAADGSPLAEPIEIGGFTVGNRWCIHPMEGWDGTPEGQPTEHTIRRWKNFGISGAKLIWGGEAFAVQHDGRANPNQLYYRPDNVEPTRALLQVLLDAHRERFGTTDDLLVGLQLTHSGRFSRPGPDKTLRPRIAYHHPLLDPKFGISPDDDAVVFTDDEIKRLIESYIVSAKMSRDLGFQFVDIKHCHGYLGHEFLSAYSRPGPYGGDFEGRTRFLREIIQGVRAECPDLMIGVRLSLFDQPPHKPDPTQGKGDKLGPGIPEEFAEAAAVGYPGFGLKRDNPLEIDLDEPIRLIRMMKDELGVAMVNVTAGSPYYVPHIQRPAYFPPSDGYQPPEDPLIGCARQIAATAEVKRAVPDMPLIGTAYTYFQEWLPNVAQAVVREGMVDIVGLGRMVLSYPDLPADVMQDGGMTKAKLICRTFSDCTTAPRNGIISGCYPLDDHYKNAPEHGDLKSAKADLKERLKVINQGG